MTPASQVHRQQRFGLQDSHRICTGFDDTVQPSHWADCVEKTNELQIWDILLDTSISGPVRTATLKRTTSSSYSIEVEESVSNAKSWVIDKCVLAPKSLASADRTKERADSFCSKLLKASAENTHNAEETFKRVAHSPVQLVENVTSWVLGRQSKCSVEEQGAVDAQYGPHVFEAA